MASIATAACFRWRRRCVPSINPLSCNGCNREEALMRGRFLLVLVAAALALGACTATYQQRDTGGIEASSIRLNPAKNIFVAIPAEGRYSSKPYARTGQLVAQ